MSIGGLIEVTKNDIECNFIINLSYEGCVDLLI